MGGWDKAAERSKQVQGGMFVKLEDGDKVVGAFLGDPHVTELFWNQKADKYETFDPKAHEGKQSTPRYRINFFCLSKTSGEKTEAVNKLQILEMNNNTFKDVLKARDKYGLDKWTFEIERSGKKGDTKTTYSVLPEAKIDDAQAKTFAEQKLHDLEKSKDDDGDASTDMNSHDKAKGGSNGAAKGDAAISADDSAALVGRLKVLPRDKVQAFLTKFGVAQVKLLKASDLPAAKAMVDELEGKGAAAPAEADPFA